MLSIFVCKPTSTHRSFARARVVLRPAVIPPINKKGTRYDDYPETLNFSPPALGTFFSAPIESVITSKARERGPYPANTELHEAELNMRSRLHTPAFRSPAAYLILVYVRLPCFFSACASILRCGIGATQARCSQDDILEVHGHGSFIGHPAKVLTAKVEKDLEAAKEKTRSISTTALRPRTSQSKCVGK